MNYRNLGRSGLKVSEVALGGWLTQGRTLEQATTNSLVTCAFDLGINFFDSADIYSKGAAETALGVAIRDLRREDLVLATKCFWPMTESPNDRGLSRKHIVESVNASLRRLGVDYIDLFQFHRFDDETPIEESVQAVDDLIRMGKILYWGVSEWRAHQIVNAANIARAHNCHLPASNQPFYNLLGRDVEADIMPACLDEGMGLVVFSPLAQGVLTGKYRPGEARPSGSRGADEKSNQFMQRFLAEDVLELVQQLELVASDAGCTLGQFALAWCLRRHEVASVIVGATSVVQLTENASASGLQIHPSLFAKAEEILSGR